MGKPASKECRFKVLTLLRKGEQLTSIARQLHISIDSVREWAHLARYGHFDWLEPGHRRISRETQKSLFTKFLASNIGVKTFAAQNNIPLSMFRHWKRAYEKYGSIDKTFENKRRGRSFDMELVVHALSRLMDGSGRQVREIAQECGVCTKTISNWKRNYQENASFRHTVVQQLQSGVPIMKDNLSKIKKENRALSKWIAKEIDVKTKEPKEIVTGILKLKSYGLSIRQACEIFSIHRSTFYRMQKRNCDADNAIVEQIRSFQTAHRFTYGAKRMAKHLSRSIGLPINHKRVARIMRQNGLNATTCRVRKWKRQESIDKPATHMATNNILDRKFNIQIPRSVFVTDMTFFPTIEGWLVLSAVKDLCTKEIVAWAFGTTANSELSIKTLKQIRQTTGSALMHSDQGCTYTSERYRQAAVEKGFVLSFSRKGNCHDNACMENFFGLLKSETWYQIPENQRFSLSRESVEKLIDTYIGWYNKERIQKSLGYRSPSEFFVAQQREADATTKHPQ